ncbi:ureidoglycolate lyase [Salinisphaera orenii]|uniref:ureidoglycolate lyase n=1 Tax=Salinisphaera orenii TaxID=856731 RepID=UPI00296E8AE5
MRNDSGAENARHTYEMRAEPLTADAFAPYGDVIASTGDATTINQGMGQRFANLASLDVTADNGAATIHRVHAVAEPSPVPLRLMERHPLSTQAFIPVDGQRYLVVVAPAGDAPGPDALRVFVATGDQGINYHRGIWHHPLIALDSDCDFLEVARTGPGANCEESEIDANIVAYPPNL